MGIHEYRKLSSCKNYITKNMIHAAYVYQNLDGRRFRRLGWQTFSRTAGRFSGNVQENAFYDRGRREARPPVRYDLTEARRLHDPYL
jgi:hypothetical protein